MKERYERPERDRERSYERKGDKEREGMREIKIQGETYVRQQEGESRGKKSG